MRTKFNADYNFKELRLRLRSIIEVKSNDNLSTHLGEIVLLRNECKVSGKINDDTFKIWTHEQGRSGATSIFYPIIEGLSKPLGQGLEIEFKSKMNVIGLTVCLVTAALLGYSFTMSMVIPGDNEFIFRRAIGATVLLSIFLSVPAIIYFRSSRIIKQYLIEKLELKPKR